MEKLHKNLIWQVIIIILIFMIFISVAVANIIQNFDGQSNPFNITFTGGDNHSYSLDIPNYSYTDNITFNIDSKREIDVTNYTFYGLKILPDLINALAYNGTYFYGLDNNNDKIIEYYLNFTPTGTEINFPYSIITRSFIIKDEIFYIADRSNDIIQGINKAGESVINHSFTGYTVEAIGANESHIYIAFDNIGIINQTNNSFYPTEFSFYYSNVTGGSDIRTINFYQNQYFVTDAGSDIVINFSETGGYWGQSFSTVPVTNTGAHIIIDGLFYIVDSVSPKLAIFQGQNQTTPYNVTILFNNSRLFYQELPLIKNYTLNISNSDIVELLIDNKDISFNFYSSKAGNLEVNLTNSSYFTNLSLNISDISTGNLITQTVDITIKNYGNFSTSTGQLNIPTFNASIPSPIIIAESDGYVTNQQQFFLTDQDSTNINMYLINATGDNTANLIVTVYDDFSNLISGVNTKLLEYFEETDSFIDISQCYTDTNGECIFSVELNNKFYIVQATTQINGKTYFAQSTQNGQILKLDNTILPLYLKTQEGYQVDDEFNLIITVTNTTLVGNTSYLTATFNDPSNNQHTVCIAYYFQNGLNQVELTSNCITASSGIINVGGGYLLDRSYNNIAKVYTVQEDGTLKIYDSHNYPALENVSFTSTFSLWLPILTLAALLGLLAISLYLKNMAFFGLGTMILSPVSLIFNPGWIGGITMTFLILLSLDVLFLAKKKQEV